MWPVIRPERRQVVHTDVDVPNDDEQVIIAAQVLQPDCNTDPAYCIDLPIDQNQDVRAKKERGCQITF